MNYIKTISRVKKFLFFLFLFFNTNVISAQNIAREFRDLNKEIELILKKSKIQNGFDLFFNLHQLLIKRGKQDDDYYILSNKLNGMRLSFEGFLVKDLEGNVFLADTLVLSPKNSFSLIHPAIKTHPCNVLNGAAKLVDKVPYYYSWSGSTILENKGFAITLLKGNSRKLFDPQTLKDIFFEELSIHQIPNIELQEYSLDSLSKFIQRTGKVPIKINQKNEPVNQDSFLAIDELFINKLITVEGEVFLNLCSTGRVMVLKDWVLLE